MRKVILALSLVVMLCSTAALAMARQTSTDSTLLVRGRLGDVRSQFGLYQYVDAAWERLPVDDFYAGSLSPDGERLAYLHVPPFLQALLDAGQDWLYTSAWDVTLLNLEDGSRREVAIQPETITTNDQGYEGGIKRSAPVWSPDGDALAWTEQDYPAYNYTARLVVYDLDSNTSRVLDEALPQMGLSADGLPVFFSWGPGGIVVFTNDPSDYAETLRFYDVVAGTQQVVRLPDDGSDWLPLAGPLWVTDAQASADGAVVVQADSYIWYQVDPATGDVTQVETQLEMVSAASPDESLRLAWDIYAEADAPVWQLLAADGTELLDSTQPPAPTRFAIAPSGQAAAYLEDGRLVMWQDGAATEIALPEGLQISVLYWGPVRWQAGATYEGHAVG